MTHEAILKMIEEVDPNDTEKMDEIDARVWVMLNRFNFNEMFLSGGSLFLNMVAAAKGDSIEVPKYTRSRDGLKAVRPEGWYLECGFEISEYGNVGYTCQPWFSSMSPIATYDEFPTEELAELYAIIQAIAYERFQREVKPQGWDV